jgi:hypothetical protein
MTSAARRPRYVFTYPDGAPGNVRGTAAQPLLTHVLVGYSARRQGWIVRRRCARETGVHAGQVWSGVRWNPADQGLRVLEVHPAPRKAKRRRRKSLALGA